MMHILTLDKDGPTLPKGRWVCEDVNAAEFLLQNRAVSPTMEPLGYVKRSEGDKRVLIVGTLGYGDAIMFTPILREVRMLNPDWETHLVCMAPQRQVFLGLPYVDGFVDYPVRLEALSDFGSIVFLEGCIERGPDARTMNMTDLFARQCGYNPDPEWVTDKKPELRLSPDEFLWAKTSFPRNPGKRRLGVQVQAGARCRTYPISKLVPEFDKMVKSGWEIALLGSPGEFRAERLEKGIADMTRHGLTWRQSVAFMTTCDVILAPDSSLMHAAGALDIPCVALFGPFPWELRTKYYSSVFALHGNGVCPMAPCFHSHHSGLPIFPAGGPCNDVGQCSELASIDASRIRAKLEQLATRPIA